MCRCGTWRDGLVVSLAVPGQQFDLMFLEGFSKQNDSMILFEKDITQVYSWTIGKLDVFQSLSARTTTILHSIAPNTVYPSQYGIQSS